MTETTAPRILRVARMHLNAWQLLLAWPLGVLAASYLISIAIFALVVDGSNPTEINGGVSSMLAVALTFYVQAIVSTLPFAVGLSVTRREFLAATALVALGQALVLGVLLYALGVLERATNYWGVGMRMFDIPAYFTDNAVLQFLSIVLVTLLAAAAGAVIGGLYLRWRTPGLLTTGVGAMLVLGAAAIVVTWRHWWSDVGHWFVDIPGALPVAVFPAALCAALAITAWAILRRAPVG